MSISFQSQKEEFLNKLNTLKFRKTLKKENETLKKWNYTRTNLLILANKELNERKKNSDKVSKINSRTIRDAERDFSEPNVHIVQLKAEKYSFSPTYSGNQGEKYQMRKGSKFQSNDSFSMLAELVPRASLSTGNIYENNYHLHSHKSVSPMKEIDNQYGSICNLEEEEPYLRLRKKTSIGQKKIQHFRRSVLVKMSNESKFNSPEPTPSQSRRDSIVSLNNHLELINIDCGILKNEKTAKRSETGFKYLRKLSRKLKKKNKHRDFSKEKSEGKKSSSKIISGYWETFSNLSANSNSKIKTSLPSPNLVIINSKFDSNTDTNRDKNYTSNIVANMESNNIFINLEGIPNYIQTESAYDANKTSNLDFVIKLHKIGKNKKKNE